MPQFAYRARSADGSAVQGQREAEDQRELSRCLRREGIFLVEVRPAGSSGQHLRRLRGRLSRQDLIFFTFHLRTYLEAGLPILGALEDLEQQVRRASARRVVREIRESISGGSTLTQALECQEGSFPPTYIGMIRAGESTGRLVECLDRILSLLEWREDLRKQLRQLATYPAIVLLALLGLGILAIEWLIPKFAGILGELNTALPLPTRILLGFAGSARAGWLWIAVGLPVLALSWFALRRIRRFRLATDRAVLSIPGLGRFVSIAAFAQVVHFLGAGMDTGMGLPESLELTAEVVDNRSISASILRVRHMVMGGETLTNAVARAGGFPLLVQRMIAIGESSGTLTETLRRAQAAYDRDLSAAIKRLASYVEPATTILMGGIVAFLLLSVLLPVYRVYESIGGAQ
jgi:type II secretory pathway component PulF